MVANFEAMDTAGEDVGCEVHEFPNSCAVEGLTEFGYTPEAFDATNLQVSRDKIAKFLKERTDHVQNKGAGMSPSLQLIVLNEDQIAAGIEDLVLAVGFTKQLETYAATYQNDIALYTKCAWESRDQAVAKIKQIRDERYGVVRPGTVSIVQRASPSPPPAPAPITGGGTAY